MNTLLILALLDYKDDLSTVIYDILVVTFSALTKKDLKILLRHLRKNILSYSFILLIPLIQALLYMHDQENSAILIILVTLSVLKKWVNN